MSTSPEPQNSPNIQALRESCDRILGFIGSAVESAQAVHKVEQALWDLLLRIGRQAMGLYLRSQGNGDEGQSIRTLNGRELNRLEALHTRDYLSIFGEFELPRVVYGTREGQKIEYVPLDERLQLPRGKFSYLLQEWNHSSALEMPFAQVSSMLERILGFRQSVNSLERSGRWCAEQVEEFWEERPVPPAEQEGELLVCSADGKGVPMRRSETDTGSEPATPSSGMRPGDKKMGLVGSVYTVDRYPRTPQQLVDALFRTPKPSTAEPGRPKPCFKQVRAALKRDRADTTAPQVQEIFEWIAKQAEQRGQGAGKPLILLMDGQESLWNAGLVYLPTDQFEVVEVLDLLHAASYVWKAVHLFYPDNRAQAEKLARKQMLRLVSGELDLMIRSFRAKLSRRQRSGKQKDELDRIIGYFRSNAERMNYPAFLAAGYPIASGVIEGACRTVIKDRMERSGMRWVFEGAHAMMSLRSIHLSGLWDEFLEYRIRNDTRRLYPQLAANDDLATVPLAA